MEKLAKTSMLCRKFYEKTASSTASVQPNTLPPTSAAVKHHSMRVYLQVHKWKSNGLHLSPEQWGWKVTDGVMMPTLTDLPPAPQKILEVIRCKTCKSGCTTACCTCRKNGLDCSMACGECRGVCGNITVEATVPDSNDTE